MPDPLNSHEILADELRQRRESGYDVAAEAAIFAGLGPKDVSALDALLEKTGASARTPDWPYEEPERYSDILDTLQSDRQTEVAVTAELEDKVLGGWLGRIAGNNLGKPVEQGDHWTSDRIRNYLELASAWPLRDYIPVLDPMPTGFVFRDNWPYSTRGHIDGAARDDDIDYAILGLHLLERHGPELTTRDVADSWLRLLPYLQVFTAERAAYANLLSRVPIECVSRVRNPYREWIGALIRADAFGWASPGRPRDAMDFAFRDATLSHTANGVYGELWAAALVSGAFTAASTREAFEQSLQYVPPRSRLAEALREVLALHTMRRSWEEALAAIQRKYGHYSWVHTINNAAIIAAGLLWGEDDFAMTVGLTVQGGWDTDSNAATAGSVCGVIVGASRLPPHFVEPLHDRTRSALFGFDQSRISDLAARTVAVVRSGVTRGAGRT